MKFASFISFSPSDRVCPVLKIFMISSNDFQHLRWMVSVSELVALDRLADDELPLFIVGDCLVEVRFGIYAFVVMG